MAKSEETLNNRVKVEARPEACEPKIAEKRLPEAQSVRSRTNNTGYVVNRTRLLCFTGELSYEDPLVLGVDSLSAISPVNCPFFGNMPRPYHEPSTVVALEYTA